MDFITSLTNNKIKQIMKLVSSRANRYELGLAVIYGSHLVEEALRYELLDMVFINQKKIDSYKELVQKIDVNNVYLVNDAVLAKIDIADTATDVIGIIRIKFGVMHNLIYEDDCIILDNIQDPGNLGTILRSCTACGIKNVLLSRSCVDPYNLKVLRASQGIQFKLNVVSEVDIIKFIDNYKYEVIAAMPDAVNSIYKHDLSRPCAWLFGNEGIGISRALSAKASCHLAIPMKDASESLNVAMAATVCLFEMLRQRSLKL